MKSHTSPKILQIPASLKIGIIFCTVWTPWCAAFQQPDADERQAARARPQLTITLDGLLKFLEQHPADQDAAAMAIKLIDLHGLNFRPTPGDLNKMKKASASSDLLHAIDLARKPPVPKPVKKEGQLEVECQPVDCAVSLNGKEIGVTRHGRLPAFTIAEGRVTVAVTSDSYESGPPSQEVLVHQNQVTGVHFRLTPSRSALIAKGTNLFGQMVDALGSAAGPVSDEIRVAGTFRIHRGGEDKAEWSVDARLLAEDRGRFDAARDHERYQIARTDFPYVWKHRPKSKSAGELEDAIRLFMNAQLPNFIRRLKAPHVTMVATDLASSNPDKTVIRAESLLDIYLITIDSLYRPSEILIESSGLNSGMRILYSDYAQEAGGAYPKALRVILPNGTDQMEAHFDTLQVVRSEHKYARAAHR